MGQIQVVYVLLSLCFVCSYSLKPHILLLVIDDWGWNDIGIRGNDRNVITPNIDQLITQGRLLNRHYTYNWCGPSRAALQTGRLPVHVYFNETSPMTVNLNDPVSGFGGIPTKMTGIAEKLKSVGYRTHMSGKWGIGMASIGQTPLGKGYETFLGYFHNSNDYWDQTIKPSSTKREDFCEKQNIHGLVDLWSNFGPAYDLNGTEWEDVLFTRNTLEKILAHDTSVDRPLFMFHSFHSIHTPLDPPDHLVKPFDHVDNKVRRNYLSMLNFVDTSIGKFVQALRIKGMYENTLIIATSDNGGPIYPGKSFKLFGGSSNFPLRGGKVSDWEGGIRVNAFVSGGIIPESVRDQALDEYIHIADWYSTICAVVGVNASDDLSQMHNLPNIDSINMWPLITGTTTKSPRKTIHISSKTLIDGDWKLLMGADESIHKRKCGSKYMPFDVYGVGWGFSAFKNLMTRGRDCSKGCLFNIIHDPEEKFEVGNQYPQIVSELRSKLEVMNKNNFSPDRGHPNQTYCLLVKEHYNGFFGPFYNLLVKEYDQKEANADILFSIQ